MTPGIPETIDIQRATVGNVTIVKVSTGGREHLYVQSSDPQTKAFKVTVRSNEAGLNMDLLAVPVPNATAHGTYKLEGTLDYITVQELQTVNTAAFPAYDERIR